MHCVRTDDRERATRDLSFDARPIEQEFIKLSHLMNVAIYGSVTATRLYFRTSAGCYWPNALCTGFTTVRTKRPHQRKLKKAGRLPKMTKLAR